MIRGEVTLVLCLALVGISWESPFSHHSSYPIEHNPFMRNPYGSGHSLYESESAPYGSGSPYGGQFSQHSQHSQFSDVRHGSRRHGGGHHNQPLIHAPAPVQDVKFPQEFQDQLDAARNKRQVFLPYFPYYAYLPPFYQVHNIILTQPGYNCYPRPSFERPPSKKPDVEPTPGPDDGLGTRLGGGDSKNTTETPSKQQPSKCVWSIVACCSPGSRDIRYACFELLGCPGAFWDVNPCDERVVTAAANSALRYYMNNQDAVPEPTFQNL